VTVECGSQIETLKIVSSLGQMVYNKPINSHEKASTFIINTSVWAKGIYIIQIVDTQGKLSQEKLVVR